MYPGHAWDHVGTFQKSQLFEPIFESFKNRGKMLPNAAQMASTPNPNFMKTWKHKFGLLFATLEACPKSLILGIPSLKKTIKKQMYNKLSKIAFDLLTRDADGGSAAADRWQRGPLIRIQPKSKPVSTIVSSKDGYIYIYIYIYSISVIIFSQGQDQG